MKYNAMRTSSVRVNPYSRDDAILQLKTQGILDINQESCFDQLITALTDLNELQNADPALVLKIPVRLSSLATLSLTVADGYYDSYMGSALEAHLGAKVTFIPPEESDYNTGVIKYRGLEIVFG